MARASRSQALLTPSQLAILFLLGLILVGTFLLSLPLSHAASSSVTPFEALFTSTSALCVTGLVVVDTGTAFSPFGTFVILILFQIGGVGMLLWSSTMIVILGGELGLRHRLLMKDQLPGMSMAGAGRLTLNVIGFVLCVESLGAVLLWFCWRGRLTGMDGVYYAFFHSASAFCNAGFSLWPDSMARDAGHVGVNTILLALIFLGGLGYAVVRDLFLSASGRKRRISIHSQIVLVSSIILTVGGAALFCLFESGHGGALQGRSATEQILISVFHTGGRTAGLSTVNIGELRPETLQLMMALMFVGGSPGSTAGGLKTTTIAILVLAAWSQIRGRKDVEAFGRRIPTSLVLQALAMTVIAGLSVLGLAFVLNALESLPFEDILFETTSALAIVGLSTGVTAKLSTVSKALLCFAMVLGRVGPLTLAMTLLRPKRTVPVRFPPEEPLIG